MTECANCGENSRNVKVYADCEGAEKALCADGTGCYSDD